MLVLKARDTQVRPSLAIIDLLIAWLSMMAAMHLRQDTLSNNQFSKTKQAQQSDLRKVDIKV